MQNLLESLFSENKHNCVFSKKNKIYIQKPTENKLLPECSQVFSITHHCTGPRHVDSEAKTPVNAALVRGTSPREKVAVVISVEWDVQYAWVGIEQLLCRVAVVHVPVDDEYPT